MQNGDTGSPHRGHRILFRAVVSALPAAPTFGCSVASLTRSADYHAPGLHSLRRGSPLSREACPLPQEAPPRIEKIMPRRVYIASVVLLSCFDNAFILFLYCFCRVSQKVSTLVL